MNNNHRKFYACHVPYMTSQYETNLWLTHVNIVRLAEPIRHCVRWRTRGVSLQAFPSFASPSPLFHFLALVSFLARSKPKIPFLGLPLLRNLLTETLATQAIFFWDNYWCSSLPAFQALIAVVPPLKWKESSAFSAFQNCSCHLWNHHRCYHRCHSFIHTSTSLLFHTSIINSRHFVVFECQWWTTPPRTRKAGSRKSRTPFDDLCFACSVRVFLLYEIDWRGIVLDVNSASSVSGFYCWKPASRENTPNMANYLRKFRLLIWKNFLLQVSSLSDRSRFCCIVELGS